MKKGCYHTNASTEGTFPSGFDKWGVFTVLERGVELFEKYTGHDGRQADRLCTSTGLWTDWDVKVSKSDLLDTIKYKPYSTVFNKIAIQNDNGKYIIHFYNGDKWICKISAD